MNKALLSLSHERLHSIIAGYRRTLATGEAVADYLVLPGLNGRAGVLEAIEIAKHRVRVS